MNNRLIDFQIVILTAGDGRRLKPLTENQLSTANRHLISHQLEFVDKLGFKEAIVVTPKSQEEKIRACLDEEQKQFFPNLNPILEIVEDYVSTTGCLSHIKHRIRNDVFVITGDLIVEDNGFLHHMADIHRARDSTVTAMVYNPPEKAPAKGKKQKHEDPPKSKEVQIIDYIGIEHTTDRLVVLMSSADLEGEFLQVNKSLLAKFPNFTLHTTWRDAHFYLFSKFVFDILEEHKSTLQSIKTHLIPFLLRCQYRPKLVTTPINSYLSPLVRDMSSNQYVLPPHRPHEFHGYSTDKIQCFAYKLQAPAFSPLAPKNP